MKVARYDYRSEFADPERLLADLRRALLEGRYGVADDVADFERAFASYVGAEHAVGVNTGTAALVVAFLALGIGPGDEVITQANTFNATVAAIRLVGATPVLVDADEETFLIDEGQVSADVGERTRAVVPVHLYGRATPLRSICALADRREIAVVEDAAQAHGAVTDGRRVGGIGTAGCFSFHPSKNLASAGDGGLVATSDARLAHELSIRRALGQDGQNNHVAVAPNCRLHALQAIVLAHKLDRLDEWNARRRSHAARYREALADLELGFQDPGPPEAHVYHLFQVRTPRRDALLRHLREDGIDAVVRYPTPIHLQPAFADQGWRRGQFPVAERLAGELLALPIRPTLTDAELEHVVSSTRRFFGATTR